MSKKMIKLGFFLLAALEAQGLNAVTSQGVLRIDLERHEVKAFDNLQLEASTDTGLIILGPNIPDETEEVMLDSDAEMNYSQLREFQRRKNAFDLVQQGDVKLSQKTRHKNSATLQMLSDDIENETNVQTEVETESHTR
jgi:predicted glycosyltransferase